MIVVAAEAVKADGNLNKLTEYKIYCTWAEKERKTLIMTSCILFS